MLNSQTRVLRDPEATPAGATMEPEAKEDVMSDEPSPVVSEVEQEELFDLLDIEVPKEEVKEETEQSTEGKSDDVQPEEKTEPVAKEETAEKESVEEVVEVPKEEAEETVEYDPKALLAELERMNKLVADQGIDVSQQTPVQEQPATIVPVQPTQQQPVNQQQPVSQFMHSQDPQMKQQAQQASPTDANGQGVLSFVNEDSHTKVMTDPQTFNEFMTFVKSHIVEEVMQRVPNLVQNNVQRNIEVTGRVTDFYRRNPELAVIKPQVQGVVARLAQENPGWSVDELFKTLPDEVRKAYGIKKVKKAQKEAARQAAAQSFARSTGGSRPGTPSLEQTLTDEILELKDY